MLLHIYVKIIKFDLSNYQMFSWLSGLAQGIEIVKREFESRVQVSLLTREYAKRNERVIGMGGIFTCSLARSTHHSDVNFV